MTLHQKPNTLQTDSFWMPFTANRQFKKAPRLFASAEGMHYTTVDDERRILDPGDAYYFESRRPHRFRCVGGKPCEVISACTPPTF